MLRPLLGSKSTRPQQAPRSADRNGSLPHAEQLRGTLASLPQREDAAQICQEVARLQSYHDAIAAMLQSMLAIDERILRIESLITELHQIAKDTVPVKEWYTVQEVAEALSKAPFTVREWCRLGRVNAAKRECGRGNTTEWIIAHEELVRIQNEGLLPD